MPEVTAPTKRIVPGVITHVRRGMDPRDVREVRGIPITSVAWVLVDISNRITEEKLGRAVHQAGVRYRTTRRTWMRSLRACPNAPGSRKLRRIIHGDALVILSALEREFPKLLRAEHLDLPNEMNRPAGGRYVDCRWVEKRLTVELDSYRFHNSRHSWERDRRREREAYARGDDFRRYTYGDVFEHPRMMLRELHALLD